MLMSTLNDRRPVGRPGAADLSGGRPRTLRLHVPTPRGAVGAIAAKTLLWAVIVVLAILLWQAVVTIGNFKSYLLPGPLEVWRAGIQFPGLILSNCWVTIYESLLGFLLGVGVGVLGAIVVIMVPPIKQVVVPGVVALNALPKVALAPIIVVLLGLGISSKIAMAFMLAFFPILINEIGGLEDVDASLLEYLRLLQASKVQTLLRARLPSSLPALCDGMKIALSLSVVGAIVGEFIAANKGLGYQITLAYSSLNTPLVFALVITVSIAALLLYGLLVICQLILFWRFPSRRENP
jgi:NitT/TauT family transport system permease protein